MSTKSKRTIFFARLMLIGVTTSCLTLESSVYAQESATQAKPSVLERLSSIQKSLSNRLRGKNRTSSAATTEPSYSQRQSQSSAEASTQFRLTDQEGNPQNQFAAQKTYSSGNLNERAFGSQSGMPARATSVDYANYQMETSNGSPYLQPATPQLPASSHTNSAMSIQTPDMTQAPQQPYAGMSQGGIGNPASATQASQPNIAGLRLGHPGLTATEYALQLKQQNDELRASTQALLARLKSLQGEKQEAESLLFEANVAMSEAQEELLRLQRENSKLSQQLNENKAQQVRDKRETDRMLQSIRDELDDVLMREIASRK